MISRCALILFLPFSAATPATADGGCVRAPDTGVWWVDHQAMLDYHRCIDARDRPLREARRSEACAPPDLSSCASPSSEGGSKGAFGEYSALMHRMACEQTIRDAAKARCAPYLPLPGATDRLLTQIEDLERRIEELEQGR